MLNLTLPTDVERKLAERAAAAGQSPEALASRIIAEAVTAPPLDETLAAVRRRFAESGMTEEQLSDLLEDEKHAMRQERRNRRAS